VTLGGGTSLGRGEVELFIGAAGASGAASAAASSQSNNAKGDKKHTTGWHTDFQENFTIQLSGIKRWTLRRGRVRHPLRGTTPHYARDASVVENQLKVARLSCLGGNAGAEESNGGSYGFEYGENNTIGEEQTITLYPGDVFYFPSGMWHTVETVEPGVSLNVSLMGTTYANLVCEALQHLMVGSDEGWREVVTCRPGENGASSSNRRLEGLLGGLSTLVNNFVTKQGGARSLLPPALCHPPLGQEEESEDESGGEIDDDCNSNEEEKQGSSDEQLMEEESDDHEGEDANDDGPPTSGIIVSIDDFEGPPEWIHSRPPYAKLVKNPLASLIAMSEITRAIGQKPQECDKQKEVTKQYVLNVNFAGNEMMESHVRVILETSNPSTIDQMDRYLNCEAQGLDSGQAMTPLCLFYYGYFSWNCIEGKIPETIAFSHL